EIATNFGVSKITVHEHLTHLEKKGAIFRLRARARGIQVLHDPDSPEALGIEPQKEMSLPLLGKIAAGRPIEAIEDRELLDLGELIPHGPNHYLLEVRGDSMIEDHILDGDYVVVERREHAQNGETVVAIIDDNEATLKRFYRESGHFRLQPANTNYPPLIRDRVQIRGVVVGVIRQVR
ncbi:MAG: transcriptional repressor LexA, partial [Planctomycetes bacterium]|nr:transcriptional repressor LexA [Planctomycetota bacterium]